MGFSATRRYLDFFVTVGIVSLLFRLTFSLSLSMSSSSVGGINAKPFALNAKVCVKAERREEFLAVITEDRDRTLADEPLSLQFVVGEDTSTPNTFYLHEQYAGKEGFDAHTATPHFASWQSFVESQPFTEDPVVQFYEPTGVDDNGSESTPTLMKTPCRKAYCLNVELCIKPERLEEFAKVIANNARGSNSDEEEPLCLQYDYGESTETPHTFHFHEEYKGDRDGLEGFEAHAASPHFGVWEKFAATNPFTKNPVVEFYRTLE